MRLLILSDLHHEIWRDNAPVIDPTVSRPDVVILAGDINTDAKAVEWAAKTFAGLPVLYVHGNHEGYGQKLEEMQNDIEAACKATKNVHFLNCSEFRVNQVRFLGATLWTDFKLFGYDDRMAAMRTAEAVMMDYYGGLLQQEAARIGWYTYREKMLRGYVRMQAEANGLPLNGEREAPKQTMHVSNARHGYHGPALPSGVRSGRKIDDLRKEEEES